MGMMERIPLIKEPNKKAIVSELLRASLQHELLADSNDTAKNPAASDFYRGTGALMKAAAHFILGPEENDEDILPRSR